ncbi:hypothetical protein BDF14DRAFT_1733311 [Spinellus fusiger]|nr:hypothetical protein BDF14DRAFT_1733311 [Spinellus fusiger]
MNFTFEGNYKSKRTINLGGVRVNDDKKVLMAKAQAERKAREYERRKLKSAGIIQAFYRGRREAAWSRQQLRLSFARLLSTLPQQLNSLPCNEHQLSLTVRKALQHLLVFYQSTKEQDNAMVAEFCRFLLLPMPHTHRSVFQWQLMQTDQTALEDRPWPILLLMKKEITLSPVLDVISLLLDVSTYTSLMPQHVEAAQAVHAGVMLFCLHSSHLLMALRSFYQHTCSKTPELLNKAFTIVLYAAGFQSTPAMTSHSSFTRRHVLEQLTVEVFSLPFLLDRVPLASKEHLVHAIVFHEQLEMIIDFYKGGAWPTVMSPERLAGVFINVTDMGNSQSEESLDKNLVCSSYARVIQYLLADLSPVYFAHEQAISIEALPVDSDSDADEELPQDVVMEESTPKRTLTPLVQERLESLYTTDKINALVQRCIQLATQSQDTPTPLFMAPMASLFNSLIVCWPRKKEGLLSTFLYHRWEHEPTKHSSHLAQIVWQAWLETENASVLSGQQTVDQMEDVMHTFSDLGLSENWSMIYLLCELYTRVLLTIGDDEFFHASSPNHQLQLNQVVQLSGQLKVIAFLLFWKAGTLDMQRALGLTGIQLIQLRSTVTKLLQQIHSRDIANAVDANDQLVEEETPFSGTRHSKGKLSVITPRLDLLNHLPFVIPFEYRVEIFRKFVENDRGNHWIQDYVHPRTSVVVHRDSVFEDGFSHLYPLGADLKKRIAISFVDEFGLQEAGIDGGGVFKEFLTALGHEAFDTNYGLFCATSEQLLYPNPSALVSEQLAYYEFLGLIIGKALYEGILLDVAFADFFLKKCLGNVNYLDDLPSLDPELYKGLITVKNFEGDVEDLCLDFTVLENGNVASLK